MIAVILTNGEAVAAKYYEPSHGVIELFTPGGVDNQRTLSLQHGEWSRCSVHAVRNAFDRPANVEDRWRKSHPG